MSYGSHYEVKAASNQQVEKLALDGKFLDYNPASLEITDLNCSQYRFIYY